MNNLQTKIETFVIFPAREKVEIRKNLAMRALNLVINLAISRDPYNLSGVFEEGQRRAKRLKSSMCNACFYVTVRGFLIRARRLRNQARLY